ncbi:cyclin-domain-containing protein [Ilyonectria robusta]|uniref:cyclin-domain-containing protein n=1 Tax=Ilyonectria robusta TaxID=1079257 RepID=UPI001E8E5337|nr:cyclin-domain-containing protein [Ilyonectria robusta]KAH8738230.1 cyclin-domain-containing protein [Ilyonectria robusta]
MSDQPSATATTETNLPISSDTRLAASDHDIFKMEPSEALKLLSANVELLVRITGDVPPTPPPKSPTVPHMKGMQAEKENIARTHSEKSLIRMRQQAELEAKRLEAKHSSTAIAHPDTLQSHCHNSSETVDGVQLKQSSTPMSPPGTRAPYIVVGADSQPINLQHGAITRKFYSKNEPPISINQYLMRLHQFCPMSTAVYLATSLYIHRLAVEERAIPVTRRNAHRLVLAGLRVAMKALEDLSYPHSKMAKVGGVSEAELARLEISFCFLAGFELVVGVERLQQHYESLKVVTSRQTIDDLEVPTLRLTRKPREQVQSAG